MPLLPFPLKLTTCGLLVALSVRVRLPLAEPGPAGLNVTLIEQLPLAAMLGAQLSVSAKPLEAEIPIAMAAPPLLVSVTT